MKLYLVRHGSYTPAGVGTTCPLNPEGKAEITRLAKTLSTLGLCIPTIFHSGQLRAIETANILAAAVNDGQSSFFDGLDPTAPLRPILQLINQQTADLMLVSHLPLIANLTDHLVAMESEISIVDYQPGTLVCLSNDSGQWRILWALNSAMY